jgi:hypothetical protein
MTLGENQNLRDARSEYFERSGFAPDGGYHDKWVEVDMGRFTIKFPNSDARLRAVRYHDLHHVLTGYETDLKGEAEISAWEIASSCRDMIAAWILNLLAFGHVLIREPRALYKAFIRGRQSRNLYLYTYDDTLLERTVSELRTELGLDSELDEPTIGNRIAFVAWGSLAIGLAWGPVLALVCLAAWWLT